MVIFGRTVMDGLLRTWTVIDGHVRSWTVIDGHGRSWTVIGGHGRSWTVNLVRTLMDCHFSRDAHGRSL